MAKQLLNLFSWSPSRDRLFKNCLRAYYYTYYGSWGGWDANAPEQTRLLYTLKNMQNLWLWSGSIVHDVIKESLTAYQLQGTAFTPESLQEQARMKLRIGWSDSKAGKWRTNPKKFVNLHEHYYGDGSCTLPRETTDKVKERVYGALENFYHSSTLKELMALPLNRWLSVDVLDSFDTVQIPTSDGKMQPLKIWSAIDLAYTDSDGITHLVDWKTGMEHRDALERQLGCYAMYAKAKWNMEPTQLRLEGVMLNDGGLCKPVHLPPGSLESIQRYIVNSATAMRLKLRDAESNTADEEDFPCNGADNNACNGCPFIQLCRGNL